MKFAKESLGNRYSIHSYTAHSIQVGERLLTQSQLICADQILPWHVSSIDQLIATDFSQALQWQPEIILLGTGTRLQFPSSQIMASIMATIVARGIGFEVMDLGAACRTFNVLVAEDRRVVAALIVGS